ncbi:MAG: DUF1735 domain-containing protein [Bacteroidales bacterium]|jgi:hypothetical protein|nr:DUF1735 domain-containing protein [Bacteroidales bacterium]
MKTNLNMKTIIKNIIAVTLFFGLVACEPYEDYVKDYDFSAVYFGTQRPVRTLVSRTGQDSLEFRTGVALGGLRENRKGYTVEFRVAPELLTTVAGANKFTLLPESCYSIENSNSVFTVPAGKFLGDCPVRIHQEAFAALPGSLDSTYALPLQLVRTTADSIRTGKDYTVIVIKYIDEHSGAYYTKGRQSQWDGFAVVPETTEEYSNADLSGNKVRLLTTLSLTQFDMTGMGNLDHAPVDDADHLLVNLVSGAVTLDTKPGCNTVTDRGSSYDADTRTFTFDYIYTRAGISYLVNEVLILRQDVEKELRFGTW